MINLAKFLVTELQVFYKQLIKHWAIITLLPILLGGLTQMIYLSKIGMPYLKFFSSTQLIQDGLFYLVIIILCLLLITPYILAYRSKNFISLSITIGVYLLLILFLCFTIYRDKFFTMELLPIPLLFSGILLTIIVLLLMINKVISTSTTSRALSIISILYIGVWIYTVHFAITGFSEVSQPNDLGNMDNIKCLIRSEHYAVESFQILYYNDKYIFTKIIHQENSQIRIFPFDAFYDNTHCQNQKEISISNR